MLPLPSTAGRRIALVVTSILAAAYLLTRTGDSWDLHWVYKGAVAFLDHRPPYSTSRPIDCVPSALLLASPLALLSEFHADVLMRVIEVGCLVLATWLSIDLVWGRRPPARWLIAAPVVLVLFDPARTIINVANIGVVSVLLVVLALRSASDRRWLAFAVLLGLALAIKPVAGALVLLPLLERKTRIALLAAAIPVSLSAVALAMSSHPAEFFTDKVPLLLHGYPEYTWTYGSLHGVLGELSVPSVLVTLARVLLGAALALTAVRRYRAGGDRGLCVAETAGCLVVATLLCSTISLNHYALFALPLLVGITRRESALRSFAGSVGLLLIASPDRWRFLTDLDRGEETAIWATGILMVAASLAWNQLRSARVADRVEPTATPDAEPALANR